MPTSPVLFGINLIILKIFEITIDIFTLMCYHTKVLKRTTQREGKYMDIKETVGYQLLVKALLSLENEQDCNALLEDLMTRKEVSDIAQRMLVAKLLSEQTVYNKIVEETGASTATISRVNRSYLYGAGGYKKALSAIVEEEK